ncbi:MAG: hypothetical protein BWY65_02243 [Firmicutes bacterium ADurb.Bin373]|nr:MAG: hypothetical protein BWY65_02243 [Firmicutes bacterium ADurb.Bin373]
MQRLRNDIAFHTHYSDDYDQHIQQGDNQGDLIVESPAEIQANAGGSRQHAVQLGKTGGRQKTKRPSDQYGDPGGVTQHIIGYHYSRHKRRAGQCQASAGGNNCTQGKDSFKLQPYSPQIIRQIKSSLVISSSVPIMRSVPLLYGSIGVTSP